MLEQPENRRDTLSLEWYSLAHLQSLCSPQSRTVLKVDSRLEAGNQLSNIVVVVVVVVVVVDCQASGSTGSVY